MFKRIVLSVFGAYLCVMSVHFSLNVGLDNLGVFSSKDSDSGQTKRSFRVGFLPVT